MGYSEVSNPADVWTNLKASQPRAATVNSLGRPLRILHLVISLRPTSTQYNEHCLPMAGRRHIALCSFFKASVQQPSNIVFFEGDGTVRGFLKTLSIALQVREYDVIHVHAPQAGILLLMICLLRRKSLRQAVYTVHNSFRNYRLRNRLLLIPVFAAFPSVVLCSDAVLASLPAPLRWLGRSKTQVVQNAVDTDRVTRVLAAGDKPRREESFTVVAVARLIERKNLATLMEAFVASCDSDSNLIFVGDGTQRPELIEKAHRWGVQDRVEFTGLLDRDEVYRRIAGAHVYVSTSWGEGLPVAVLEAMACACPVILSDIPPHREIAGETGFIPLVPPDDVEGFAHQIDSVRRLTPEQRTEIGQRCRAVVVERFSLQAMHRSYEEIYAQRIGHRPVP